MPISRDNPRNGGLGVSRHWRTKFASAGVPQRLLVSFPRGKETRPIGRNPIKRAPVVAPYKSKETTLAARRRRNTSAENPPSGPMRASGPTGEKTTGAARAGPRPAKKRPGQKNLRMHRRGGGNIPTPLFTRLFDLCPFAVSPSDDGSLSQTQWVRRTRPLARRRASTLRPLRVAIRLRKPCSLERWRFLG